MTLLAVIRHGTTDWNRRKIVQGSSDIPLDDGGRAEVADWSLPPEIDGFRWLASPLVRAAETGHILSGSAPETDPRLAEMSWGEWEGRVLSQLREELGDLMVAWESDGLDFRGPNGESPREVQDRLRPLLGEISEARQNTVAVCHKGVIRALYALAADWDMADKPPQKLHDGCVQIFRLDDIGHPSVHQLNLDMTGR